MRLVRELLQSIVAQVASAVETGQNLEELQHSFKLDEFRTRLPGDDPLSNRVFDRFIPETIERAYAEAKSEVGP
ncbi:MAG: hypothetical protein V3V11_00180 [Vicinamibacteria bacterium]